MSDLDLWDLDISQSAELGAKMVLCHPVRKEPLPIGIYLKGKDAPTFRRTIRRQIDWQISEGKADLSAVEMERHLVERLAAATVGWEGIKYQGESFPFSERNAEKLYSEQIWIREQVQQFIDERANFLKD